MKINSANMFINQNSKTNANQNFKGLWGRTKKSADIDQLLEIKRIKTTAYYFPFKNEPAKEYEKAVRDYNFAEVVKDKNKQKLFLLKECKLCAYLPFTKEQYEEYMKSSGDEKYKEIHEFVSEGIFANGEYGEDQPTAANKNFNCEA